MSSSNNSSHADDVLTRARRIVEESMRARQEHARRMAGYRHERSVVADEARRVPAVRPVRPLDEEAFDVALSVWHRTYAHAYRPVMPSDAREAHDEATRDALEAAIGCYEETRR